MSKLRLCLKENNEGEEYFVTKTIEKNYAAKVVSVTFYNSYFKLLWHVN